MALGVDVGYFAFKKDGTDATMEDVEYICLAVEKAIAERGMDCGGGGHRTRNKGVSEARLKDENEDEEEE